MGIRYENRTNFCAIRKTEHLGCAAHIHKEIEIAYISKGKTKAYLDSKEYIVEEGDLFVSFPNKVHYFDNFTEEECYLLMFSPEVFPDFNSVFMENEPINPVIKKENLPGDTRFFLNKALYAYNGDEKYKAEKVKGYVNIFLADIIPCLDFVASANNHMEMISSILSYCVEHYKDNISLDEMAKDLHASKYYISRIFSEKIKIGFNDYINMLRINDAKEHLIKTNDSVTEIGINVGYNTIRSFNRAFLSQTGMQPREYRNVYRNSKNENSKLTEIKEEKTIEQKKEPEIINVIKDFECCF